MADVPRLYMPIYILIRVPLLMLFGAALTMISAQWLQRASPSDRQQREITLLSLMVIVSAGLPGDLAGPRLHRVAPFPVLDSRPCGPVRYRPRQVDCGAASPRSRGSIRRPCDHRDMPAVGRDDPGQAAPLRISVLQLAGRRPRRRVAALRSRLLVRQHARGHQPSRSLFAPHRAWQRSPADAHLLGRRMRRTPAVRESGHASPAQMGFQAGMERVRLLHCPDPVELRRRCRRQGHRHRRTPGRRHRLHQGPAGTNPPETTARR